LTLLRRAYFDLIGLAPAPDEIERFANDNRPEAYAELIERLLASPQYGECWARHWLDVARYADTGGFEHDFLYPNAWRYRDYVIRAFNADKSFDRFIQEQVAGDELWPGDSEAVSATALYSIGPVMQESAMISNHDHDLHATILKLLGLDHTRLTSLFQGREQRLTDAGGDEEFAARLLG